MKRFHPIAGLPFLVFLLGALMTPMAQAADLLVGAGKTVPLGGDQLFDEVAVESGGTLVLNGNLRFTCSRFTLAGKLVISGDTVIETTYGKSHPDSPDWAFKVAPSAPLITVDYPLRAEDGVAGADGVGGSPGVSGHALTLIVHGDLFIESSETRTTKLAIELNGQTGGSGATADGGKSGNAGLGGKGGTLSVTVHGALVGAPYGGLDWSADGGWGGYDGGPDNPETSGGSGGDLSQGGNGGSIRLNARRIDANIAYSKFSANGGGAGGHAGDGYFGDPAGAAAPGGGGGQIAIVTAGDLEPVLRWTFEANGGAGGRTGSCYGGQCYWWKAHCACHEPQNWTGQGGRGGTITVEAGRIDNLEFFVRGGDGGIGETGHNMMCQHETDGGCLWGANDGVRVGNGGDGASAGNGGIVSAVSRVRTIGPGVTYILYGGQGGASGKGGQPFCTGGVRTCCTTNACPSGVNGASGVNGSPGTFQTKRQGGHVESLPLLLDE
jgi:hypothetical protein